MSATAIAIGLGALANVAGSYYNNMVNAKNQLAINKANIGMQYAFNADQIAVAQMNNQTQIDMANTAHQREVQDLRDAGLNPILSATGGNGAAMPSLGAPSGLSAPEGQAFKGENPLRELGTSAAEIGRYLTAEYRANVEVAKQQAEQEKEFTKQSKIQTRNLVYSAEAEKLKSQYDIFENKARLDAQDFLLSHDNHNASFFKRTLTPDTFGLDYYISPSPFSDEHIDTIKRAILADYAQKADANIHRWIESGSKAAGALGDVVGNAVKSFVKPRSRRH